MAAGERRGVASLRAAPTAVAATGMAGKKRRRPVEPGHSAKRKAKLVSCNPAIAGEAEVIISTGTTRGSELTRVGVEAPRPRGTDEGDSGEEKHGGGHGADYAEEIFGYYRQAEAHYLVAADYLERQPHINQRMRAVLVDWLVEVHHKFQLLPQTLFLTCSLIDRFLQAQAVSKRDLRLLGVSAMFLAAKFEEERPVGVHAFLSVSSHSREQVLAMEKCIWHALGCRLSAPTAYVFLLRCLEAAAAGSDKPLELLSCFLLELCLVESSMVPCAPSLLAAAAVYTAGCLLNRAAHWTSLQQQQSGYREFDLLKCSGVMKSLHRKAADGQLTTVHRKYASLGNKPPPAASATRGGGATAASSSVQQDWLQQAAPSPASSCNWKHAFDMELFRQFRIV